MSDFESPRARPTRQESHTDPNSII